MTPALPLLTSSRPGKRDESTPEPGRVEVWTIGVRRPYDDLARLLSADEAERAGRFRFAPHRQAFVVTRGVLRRLAGRYLDVAPESVTFSYGPQGKPEVAGLAFNVSHAGDLALVAVAPAGRVGVDVEAMRPGVEMRALARRFFTDAENEALDRLSDADLARGFYGCWTAKEAFVKAVGQGVSFGLGRVEVAVPPAAPALVALDGDPAAARAWTLTAVDAGPGYAAAVVCDLPGAEVVVRGRPGERPG
ncbi:MAG TPA: 4'-phosphopantetheinyl transferase superfamily protein [Actinomycetota bacterium]|nr:4'-phosphopantetheinyl transferase superfamily protein [Actinomycetota bacterium]